MDNVELSMKAQITQITKRFLLFKTSVTFIHFCTLKQLIK